MNLDLMKLFESYYALNKSDENDLPFTGDCMDGKSICEKCDYFDRCMEEEMYADPDYDVAEEDFFFWGIPRISRIIFNNPATIVIWEDGTKTIVRCMKGEKFEKYAGFAAACMKKMFGSTSLAKSIVETMSVDQAEKRQKKQARVAQEDSDETLNG